MHIRIIKVKLQYQKKGCFYSVMQYILCFGMNRRYVYTTVKL